MMHTLLALLIVACIVLWFQATNRSEGFKPTFECNSDADCDESKGEACTFTMSPEEKKKFGIDADTEHLCMPNRRPKRDPKWKTANFKKWKGWRKWKGWKVKGWRKKTEKDGGKCKKDSDCSGVRVCSSGGWCQQRDWVSTGMRQQPGSGGAPAPETLASGEPAASPNSLQ